MAKRVAGKQLTDQNWEEEEEAEEAGVFKTAKEDVLKTRQIKSAKRRFQNTEPDSAGAFKGFSGFGATKPTSDASSGFSFGATKTLPGLGSVSNGDKPASGFTFGAKPKEDGESKPAAAAGFTFGSPPVEAAAPKPSSDIFGAKSPEDTAKPSGFSFGSSDKDSIKPATGFSFGAKSSTDTSTGFSFASSKTEPIKPAQTSDSPKKNGSGSNSKYLAQLKGLNEAVTKWIKEHVDKNPYIILTPIFTDYQKYIEEIEKENPEKDSSEKKSSTSEPKTTPTFSSGSDSVKPAVAPSGFSFSVKKAEEGSTSAAADNNDTKEVPSSSLFSFGASATTTGSTTLSGFSFKPKTDEAGGEGKPFSFATGGSAPSAENTHKEEDEDYVPPKAESVEIKEDDAVYTKRCKLFYQKEGSWTERGVGNLYIKPLDGKTQLLIRADNTLGTVLLNIMLSSAIPLKRQGKNNVSMICTPNPPIDPKDKESKPVSMLIRVKTAEDADDLLEQLEKHKS